MSLEPIKYKRGELSLLDQTRLPQEFLWEEVKTIQDAWDAISLMKVRGAPAIAISGMLAVAAIAFKELDSLKNQTPEQAKQYLWEKLDYLRSSRPTAVNLFNAINEFQENLKKRFESGSSSEELVNLLINDAERLFADDLAGNKQMGKFGADRLCTGAGKEKIRVLTHCNTGSLATAGYGTALGVIRALHESGRLEHAYCTETRPYNQGSRLTALELRFENIPSTLITDSMAGALMAQGKVDAIVVGGDRVVANGDTANKIGTYALSVLANYHNIKFYVAVPLTTLDPHTTDGSHIEIEQRSSKELTHFHGIAIAPEGMPVWNPAFDVAPAKLIEAIITDVGVIEKPGVDQPFDVPSYVKLHSAANN